MSPGGRAPGKSPGQFVQRRLTGVMGTELVVEAFAPSPLLLEGAIDAAVAEIRRVEDVMTEWRPSELTRLNDSAGTGPVPVPRELAEIVEKSFRISRLSGGAFDVTFAAVGRLWDFKQSPPVIPQPEEIRSTLGAVGYERVKVDLGASIVELPKGTRLGLGGIAKGYGVDRAAGALLSAGVEDAVVSAGGDMRVLGRRLGKPWKIAVRHPRDGDRVLAVLPVSNVCVVTSGDYFRFFDLDGRRYHHNLDPRTGYPTEGCISATVLGPDGAEADALATACCVLGPQRGLELIEGLPRTEALLVDPDGGLHLSSGLRAPGQS